MPLQRVRVALAASNRSITEVRRLVYAAEHGGFRSRWKAGLQLVRVPDLMDKAAAQLAMAAEALALSGRLVEAAAHRADDRAPNALIQASREFLAVGQQLVDLSNELNGRFTRLREWLEAVAEEVAHLREEAEARPPVPRAEPSALRQFLKDYLALAMVRLSLLRRRRSRTERVADAPRRISRGRAPPFALACSL